MIGPKTSFLSWSTKDRAPQDYERGLDRPRRIRAFLFNENTKNKGVGVVRQE